MQIYLVRHTETICPKGVCYGQSNVNLAPNFLEQFQEIKKKLPEKAFVYSSPLTRCLELAEYCFSKQEITVDNRLKEMNFGKWELQKWDAIPEEELNPWMEDFVNISVPMGESFQVLYERVVEFWEIIQKMALEKPLVIFTHAGVIRSLICYLEKQPLKDAFNYKVDFGEVKKVSIK
ncbi:MULTISPECIES: alpha-ribazole phosphatase [Flavobacterium]|uniref:Alpha-ribazole phosphatase n=1 Tax=Flavobacterium columnare TaxID=996 RepID=A0AA94F1X4_9FLAO|nr:MULTISPECIES: alpha-ribazole phosphatase [Flavobacterium]MCH4828803.1 alpha-ribazole phosphatase [Flavobacterium columnare]MCH4832057.1 alpha-ribazole phosphatase [Flavobacterium columnare]OWP87621.1 alpha-ribazole phosphatase [Flavobacterium covae]OXA80503.1 alpha-ribazole phosphatase [Flavobacterium columnare] [Flavobacterium columnare NBRC 100251 = ATCC 23463]